MVRNIFRLSMGCIVMLHMVLPMSAAVSLAGESGGASLLRLGAQLLSRGEYDAAVRTFELAVRRDPGSAEGYAGLGRGYLKLGANEVMTNPMVLEKGAEVLETALRINPALMESRRDLGLTWLALGNRERPLQELKILRKADPRLGAELASAIADFRPPPVYRAFFTEKDSESSETRVQIERNAVMVPVTLSQGARSAEAMLLLDTGAAVTVINPAIASRLGMRLDQAPVGKMQVVGGGNVEARAVRLDRICVGPHTRSGMLVAVIEHRGHKVGFDGLLGMDFLRDVRYQVNFKSKTITWLP